MSGASAIIPTACISMSELQGLGLRGFGSLNSINQTAPTKTILTSRVKEHAEIATPALAG